MLAVLFLLPTVGVLLSSVKTTREISMGELWSLPASLYLGNFAEVLGNPAVHRYFLNTLLVTLPATAGLDHAWAFWPAMSLPSCRSAARTRCSW